MKNILLLIGLLNTSFLFSQNSKFQLGVNVGPNLTYFVPENSATKKKSPSVTGYLGGLDYQYNFKKTVSIYSGVYYELKNSFYYTTFRERETGVLFGEGYLKTTLEYISIPVEIKFYVERKRVFYVHFGGYSNFLIKHQSESRIFENSSSAFRKSSFEPISEKEIYKEVEHDKFIFGLMTGFGFDIYLKENLALKLEVRESVDLKASYYSTLAVLSGITLKLGNRKIPAQSVSE